MSRSEGKKFVVTREFHAMGTDVTIDIVTENTDDAQMLSDTIRALFEEFENVFSRFRQTSELSQLNAQCDSPTKVSSLLFSAIESACTFYDETNGYFDPRILGTLEGIGYDQDFHGGKVGDQGKVLYKQIKGSLRDDIVLDHEKHTVTIKKRLDLSGIAKSIALKAAAQVLEDAGMRDFIVDAGGDMVIRGSSASDEKWRIGLETVSDEELLLGLKNESLATSGITRRQWSVGGKQYHHLINPKIQGKFSFDIMSITVVDPDVVTADVWAKTLFLMGDDAKAYAEENNIAALFLDSQKKLYATKEIKEKII